MIMGAYGDERVHGQLGVWVPGPTRSERGLPVLEPSRQLAQWSRPLGARRDLTNLSRRGERASTMPARCC